MSQIEILWALSSRETDNFDQNVSFRMHKKISMSLCGDLKRGKVDSGLYIYSNIWSLTERGVQQIFVLKEGLIAGGLDTAFVVRIIVRMGYQHVIKLTLY